MFEFRTNSTPRELKQPLNFRNMSLPSNGTGILVNKLENASAHLSRSKFVFPGALSRVLIGQTHGDRGGRGTLANQPTADISHGRGDIRDPTTVPRPSAL